MHYIRKCFQSQQKVLDNVLKANYNRDKENIGGDNMRLQKPEIKLTNDTLENIRIMAPYLDKESQNHVYGMMFGILKTMDSVVLTPETRDKAG